MFTGVQATRSAFPVFRKPSDNGENYPGARVIVVLARDKDPLDHPATYSCPQYAGRHATNKDI